MKTVRRKSSSLASPVPPALAVAAAAPLAGNTACRVFHESRHLTRRAAQASANSEVFTKHESRNTNHGFYAFPVARLVPVGTEALQPCFFCPGLLSMTKEAEILSCHSHQVSEAKSVWGTTQVFQVFHYL